MTNPQAEEYLQARLESCKLLAFDPNNLTPHEAVRADVVTVLRLSLDAQPARTDRRRTRGETSGD